MACLSPSSVLKLFKPHLGHVALGTAAVGAGVALCFAPVRAAVASAFTSYISPFATASFLVMKGAFLKLAATHAVTVIAAAVGLSSAATLSLGIGLVALAILGIAGYEVYKHRQENTLPKSPYTADPYSNEW